jgi:hypothetical protein
VSTSATPEDVTVPTDPKELRQLLGRARQGDEKTLPVLRKLLEDPARVNVLGNLARQAELALIRTAAGGNLCLREALGRKLELMRAELAGADPAPLERLLAERVVACWLHLYHLEMLYAQRDSLSLELGTYYQKTLDRAHKRYLSAIKTLALVRKLTLPVLQVNIGRRQVNVARPCPDATAGGSWRGPS